MPAKSIRRFFEILLFRVGQWTIPFLPRRGVLGLAGLVGRLAPLVAPSLDRVAAENIRLALGHGVSSPENRAIRQTSFRTFVLCALDMFWFSRRTRARMERWVRQEPSMQILDNDRAQICITAHLGNWELMGQTASLFGRPLYSVAAPIENSAVDNLYNHYRRITGQEVVPQRGAIRSLLKILRAGDKAAFLLDQNTKPTEGGVFVDFFGYRVPMSEAPAALALRTGTEIVFGYCLPEEDGKYRAYMAAPLLPDSFPKGASPQASHALTQAIARRLEEEIRDHAHHWMWSYKRWKHVPDECDKEDYPFYAKRLDERDSEKYARDRERLM